MTDRTPEEATQVSGFGSWPPRHDPSSVGPFGSYTAKRCPVRIQWDIVRPVEPLTVVPMDLQLRFDMGNAFEEEMVAELRRLARDTRWVFVDEQDDPLERTVWAVADGATVIVGGRLPLDETGRRIGDPDLLVAHPDGGYLPVDIKHHLTVREKRPEKRQRDAVITDLDDLEAMVLTSLADSTQRLHDGDALQLAHYRRMLQSAGWAAPEGLAGIIGKEGHVTWYDLDLPLFQTPAKTQRKRARRTAMERYDFEFGFRLDIATVATRVVGGSDEELLVDPMACSECTTCPWHDHCMGIMESKGDLSLVTGTDYSFWRPLREVGISTAEQLGQLDPHTASVMSRLDIPGLLRRVEGLPAETPMDQVISARATTQLADAAQHGLVTVADLRALHSPTIETGIERSFFPQIIERARAFAGHADVYVHPRGVDDPVPRADVEIDIDMENGSDERVYLWGALLNRNGRSEYVPFVSWDVLDETAERDLFTRFWSWFTSIRTETIAAGGTFRAYCWYAGAENKRLQDLSSDAVDLADEVATFIASPEWVDLYVEFAKRYLTGRSLSLKVVAPLAGFNWVAPDAGGGPSMVYHLDAVDTTSPTSADSQKWLLTYNRNDVEATARIREWVDNELQAPPLIAGTPGGGARGTGGGEGGI